MPAERPPAATAAGQRFGAFVAERSRAGELVLQPRMGFGAPAEMRRGLAAVRAAGPRTVGTITVDSFTRVGAHEQAAIALAGGTELNGYPLVTHPPEVTERVLAGIAGADFPVQVRHGSALPSALVAAALECGLTATEGGPVSYCLPYSRVPLAEAVADWARACAMLARHPDAHLESFGGCMLGQLCPPSLLVALDVLECLFFRQHGLRSVSLSYAQQTDSGQDAEALAALRTLAGEFLGDLDWHVVLYTYMGVFPRTRHGAAALLRESVRLAVATGTERLVLKTRAEAFRIPSVEDNVAALKDAHAAAARFQDASPGAAFRNGDVHRSTVYREARTLIETVLALSDDLGAALLEGFRRGFLDVPYCLHHDNKNRARTYLGKDGRLCWASVGAMPLEATPESAPGHDPAPGSVELLRMLNWVRERFDRLERSDCP
ncbi:methylaspartate mutase [Actinomadura rugatobispora]|uniref:Methylaspartate mutase n=1 Tax=Actinomadura rugatobispora TaxID=1994 RepID=A0ABW0ZPK9_9ACTN|nr:methylaspartate mutase [Actinomadura rugatobispora]